MKIPAPAYEPFLSKRKASPKENDVFQKRSIKKSHSKIIFVKVNKMVKRGTEIPELRRLIRLLTKASSAQKAGIWYRAVELLNRPRRRRVEVNLVKLNLLAHDDKILLVPGKVLGNGTLRKKFTVAAYQIAKPAAEKLRKASCTVMSIPELVKKDPKGSRVIIVI